MGKKRGDFNSGKKRQVRKKINPKIPEKENIKYYPEVIERIYSNEVSNPLKTRKSRKRKYHEKMQRKHSKALEEIKSNPKLIGIEEIVKNSEIEVKFKGCQEEGEADMVILSENIAYYVEYKCTDCDQNIESAKKQLRKAKRCINGKYQKDLTKLLYVREDFKTDLLTTQGFIPFNYAPNK